MLRASPRCALLRALTSTLIILLSGVLIPAAAATPNLAALLRPGNVRIVQLSPSGARVAALLEDPQSGSNLLVLEAGQGKLLLSTHLGVANAIASYQWLSDDYIAIYYASAEEDFPQFGIVDIPHHAIKVQDPLTRIEKAPWGDNTHILVSASGVNCSAVRLLSRCLLSMNIRSGGTNRISDPFTDGPSTFLAVSPSEIYASGRNDDGSNEHDFQLELVNEHWKPVAVGTLERRRQELLDSPVPPDVQQQRARAQMPAALPVWTEPDHHLVGLQGMAPQRPFLALDSRLDGMQALLEQRYRGARVQISGLNADLTRGMVTIDGPDQPPLFAFFNSSGSLTQFTQLESDLSSSTLGRTHVERAWVPDMPVAVTLPPQGTAPIGAIIEPIVAAAQRDEEPLAHYDGIVQVFAQSGLVVVRPLIVIPSSFDTSADGGVWRQAQGDRLRMLMSHVRSELVPGRAVCLYGEDLAATLALAWSAGTQVDCTVAVDARLDPAAYTHKVALVSDQPSTSDVRVGKSYVPAGSGQVVIATTNEQLHRDLPAQFGISGSGQLSDPTQWAAQLPTKLMLAYDMNLRQQQEFANESAAFRQAAQHAGRQLDFYDDAAKGIDDVQSRDRLLQAVISYLQQNMTTAASASAAARAP